MYAFQKLWLLVYHVEKNQFKIYEAYGQLRYSEHPHRSSMWFLVFPFRNSNVNNYHLKSRVYKTEHEAIAAYLKAKTPSL